MDNINPDHLKYMPHSSEENEVAETSGDVVAEEIVESVVTSDSEVYEVTEALETVRSEEASKSEKREGKPVENDQVSDSDGSRLAEMIGKSAAAGFIYCIFGPLFIPTISTILVFLLSLLVVVAPGAALPYSLTVFGATCLLPGIAFFILMKTGFLHSYQIMDRTERIIPYVVEFLALGAMAIFFVYKGASPWIWSMFCGGAAVTLVNMVLNFKIRISNHCSGIAALLAVLIVIQTYGMPPFQLFWWLTGTALLTGIVGSLAILRGRHTLLEVFAGYVTGFLGIILFSLIH